MASSGRSGLSDGAVPTPGRLVHGAAAAVAVAVAGPGILKSAERSPMDVRRGCDGLSSQYMPATRSSLMAVTPIGDAALLLYQIQKEKKLTAVSLAGVC
jgi:hypothetical protein